jgi:hypothetical protein
MPLATFVDVVNETLNFGFNDGPQVNRGRIQNWVNEAQRQIARQIEGPEFQTNLPIVLIPNTYSYALPADFLRVQDIAYPALSTRLRPVDLGDFDMANVAQVAGPPSTYTLDQSNLFLFPNPSAADTLTMRYLARPATLVNDSDVPTLNSDYLHLLVMYAVTRGFEGEDDIEMAQYYMQRYKSDLANYASDVQWRDVDRPRQVDGTWSSGSVSSSAW